MEPAELSGGLFVVICKRRHFSGLIKKPVKFAITFSAPAPFIGDCGLFFRHIRHIMPENRPTPGRRAARIATGISHALVLAGSAVLIAVVSMDALQSMSLEGNAGVQRLQTALCCLFLADIVLEIFRKPWGWKNVVSAAGGIVLCLPYTAILGHTGIHLPYACSFGLWLLPLVRAVTVLAQMFRSLRIGPATSMLGAYLALVALVLYFGALMFYILEYGINPEVHSLRSAIYWGVMALTTTGSQISEMTTGGQVLAIVMSATRLVLLPVFTIYISAAVQSHRKH